MGQVPEIKLMMMMNLNVVKNTKSFYFQHCFSFNFYTVSDNLFQLYDILFSYSYSFSDDQVYSPKADKIKETN